MDTTNNAPTLGTGEQPDLAPTLAPPFTCRLERGTYKTVVTFPGKPSVDVLALVKGMGLRWDRFESAWVGRADFDKTDKALRAAFGLPPKPDGACQRCKSPQGFWFKNGAFPVLYCEACYSAWRAAESED